MGDSQDWKFDLDQYVREGEPDQAQRAGNWQIAIGLQAVDGLKTSDYLLETAKEHIEGRIDAAETQRRIRGYYEERSERGHTEESEEADKASSKIAELLGERAFTFSPAQLQTIHRRIFDEILLRAGKYRTYNITKREWVLKGATVYYAPYDTIVDTLKYDFDQEKESDYRAMSTMQAISHFAAFVSGIWQIHPFSEGNTRTTAVFAIKYLRSLGYDVDNEPFKNHSWYFRNALVRANFNDYEAGVQSTDRFLVAFFENLLAGANHELKNRFMHIDWRDEEDAVVLETTQETAGTTQETAGTTQETAGTTQETAGATQETTKERILMLLETEPSITARQISIELGISFDGVRYHLAGMRKAGLIHHEGPTKGGRWVVHAPE